MGALTENHRCPRGRFSKITDALSTVMVGAVLGGVLVFLVVDQPAGALVTCRWGLGRGARQRCSPGLGPSFLEAARDAKAPDDPHQRIEIQWFRESSHRA